MGGPADVDAQIDLFDAAVGQLLEFTLVDFERIVIFGTLVAERIVEEVDRRADERFVRGISRGGGEKRAEPPTPPCATNTFLSVPI